MDVQPKGSMVGMDKSMEAVVLYGCRLQGNQNNESGYVGSA